MFSLQSPDKSSVIFVMIFSPENQNNRFPSIFFLNLRYQYPFAPPDYNNFPIIRVAQPVIALIF